MHYLFYRRLSKSAVNQIKHIILFRTANECGTDTIHMETIFCQLHYGGFIYSNLSHNKSAGFRCFQKWDVVAIVHREAYRWYRPLYLQSLFHPRSQWWQWYLILVLYHCADFIVNSVMKVLSVFYDLAGSNKLLGFWSL